MRLFSVLTLAAAALTFTACSDDSSDPDPGVTPPDVLSGTISSNRTLTADKKYTLQGNVFVASGVTLTIEPGTIIFGDKTSKGALIIERGGKISAAGTESKPIIFTSSAPKVYRNVGDWGGVIILGKAKNNQAVDKNIEGITASNSGLYGGTDDADNSGVFKYVRIEFAGIALSTDNEINGLTLGSVGSGTELHHVQVSYSGDDAFEWFGGTVNSQYLVAYRTYDDDFDTDFGFTGKVQYAVSFRDPNLADKSFSNGFESDNNAEGDAKTPKTAPIFSNVTWFGPHVYSKLKSDALDKAAVSLNYQNAMHLRRNSDIQVYNSVFVGSQLEGVHFDKTGAAAAVKGNYFGRIAVNAGKVVKKVTTGNSYDDSKFDADNFFAADQATVDLSATFANMKGAMDIGAPSALLATGSSLLSGAKTVPAGLEQKQYIGAFDASSNWMSGWTNFDPINAEY